MRISGTIVDRFIFRIFPSLTVLGLFAYPFVTKPAEFFKGFFSGLIILWLFDSFLILSKKVKRLRIEEDKLIIGSDSISSAEVLMIAPKRDKRKGTSIRTIEIEFLKDGLSKKHRVMNKPTFLDFLSFSTRFKTLEILTAEFPELKTRVLPESEDV